MDWRGTQTKLTGELRKRNGLASYANEKTGEVHKQDKQQREDEKKFVT